MIGVIKKPRGYPASATFRGGFDAFCRWRGVVLVFSNHMGSVDAETEPGMTVMPGVQKVLHLGEFGCETKPVQFAGSEIFYGLFKGAGIRGSEVAAPSKTVISGALS